MTNYHWSISIFTFIQFRSEKRDKVAAGIKIKRKSEVRETGPQCNRSENRDSRLPRRCPVRSLSRPPRRSIMRLETTGARRSSCTYALRRFPNTARYRRDRYRRHVEERRNRVRERESSRSAPSGSLALAPGSCLAHKESSERPFLPTFLPSSCCSCTSSESLLFRPSLFPRPSSLPRPSTFPSSLPNAPFLRCPPAC